MPGSDSRIRYVMWVRLSRGVLPKKYDTAMEGAFRWICAVGRRLLAIPCPVGAGDDEARGHAVDVRGPGWGLGRALSVDFLGGRPSVARILSSSVETFVSSSCWICGADTRAGSLDRVVLMVVAGASLGYGQRG